MSTPQFKSDRDRLRQKAADRRRKRIEAATDRLLKEWNGGRPAYQCMAELEKAAKGDRHA